MSDTQMANLDIQCAELGREMSRIPGVDEKTINAALSVLEEQGPYAMFLHLKARHDKVADDISDKTLAFLRNIFRDRLDGISDILKAIKKLAENLDDLLFARDLLRTALSYARYHLKAKRSVEEAS